MSAELEHAGSLHAADAAADDVDGLGRVGLLYVVLVPLHRLSVDSAAGKMQAVGKLLIVGHALVVAHVEAAVVAENAGTDVILLVIHHLRDPLLIGEELTRESCAVKLAFLYRVRGNSRIEAAGADNGNVAELLDVFNILEVAVLGHVDGRVSPVPCVVCAVVAVEAVITGILKILDSLLGLCHIASYFGIGLARERALTEALGLGNYAVAQGDREVVAARLLDSLNYLDCETIAILKRAAVFVGALVDIFKGELVEQIALVDCVNLNAVNACVLEHLCALCERIDKLLDFSLGHLSRGNFIRPAVGRGARGSRDLVEIHEGLAEDSQRGVGVELLHHFADGEGTAEACGQLNEELRAGLVELGSPLFEVGIHLLVLVEPLAEHGVVDRLTSGENKTRVVLRDFHDKACAVFIEVVLLHPSEEVGAAHAREHDAVLDLAVADLPRSE